MRVLDKYIVKHVASGYFFILLTFIGLYLIIDLFSNLSDILKTKPPLAILGQYYLNSLPLIISRVSPPAILISTLYTFGELNKNNEIISIRASGLSVLRIATPVIFFSLLISVSVFSMQEKILIHSQKKIEDIKSRFIKNKIALVSEERNLAFTSGDMIFFVEKFIPKTKTLQNVIIFKEDENRNIVKKIICKSIIYEYGFWIAQDVIEYSLNEKGDISDIPVNLSTKKIDLKEKPRELILKRSIFSQYASLSSLRGKIERLKKIKSGNLLSNLIIDYYQKIAEPFSHFFLVMGILPLALEIKKKKVGLSSLGVGLIFYIIYYTFSSFSIALGKSGIILPILSAWLTPLFFLTVGITGLSLTR